MTPSELFSTTQEDFVPRLATFTTDMVARMWNGQTATTELSLPLRTYVEQVILNSGASPSVLLLALKYIQRITKGAHLRTIDSLHHAVVVAIMLAHKVLEDDSFTNASWSWISGIEVGELTTVEQTFLVAIGFDLFVSEVEFTQWVLYIEQYLRFSRYAYGILNAQDNMKENGISEEPEAPRSWWRCKLSYGDRNCRTPSSVV
ncbi:hypothetical protein K493DRAFT_307743 [Basidiobolus meristosporus CBS 931.73]|uniref:Cyclin N-terminal domain-containing protein n=1 Tax=Basidiobolus meristosporus CBS 931.73 TaxID=1314790 RepID=A0A1Y1XBQ3_9FUNG|nr:hypothetical protein K493DRAFT_307743 [Basidiobolus meristosporus CBS 931.73]|eukprot:ORX82846.1 hypothetical protein K493DRAFT_307743 [Basidiobolus meristosporus CBS 931.73]